MSVKELLSQESVNEIRRLKDLYPYKKSAVLMALHVIHGQFGYLDKPAMDEAARLLEVAPVDVEQAASFYTMFPDRKVGRYHIQVCRTLSCSLMGAEELVKYLGKKLEIRVGEVTPDGLFSLTEVECLGSCGTAPMMQVNDVYYEELTPEKVEKILFDLRQEAQNG